MGAVFSASVDGATPDDPPDVVIRSPNRGDQELASGGPVPGSAKELVRDIAEIVMPLAGLIDVAAEQARIAKDIGKADKEIAALEKKLANDEK